MDKKRKVYQDWKKHLEFFKSHSDKENLKYLFDVLEERRSFRYQWISDCNKIAMDEVLKDE